MNLIFTEQAWDDYLWFQVNERKLLKKINTLIKDIQREPYDGLGKPEALKSNLSGYWSRRIDSEHRLVYEVNDTHTEIVLISCRHHYHK